MTEQRPVAIIYCELLYGAGHLMRAKAVALGLACAFRAVLAVRGEPTEHLCTGDGIETVILSARTSPREMLHSLMELLERLQPSVILIEYFPFGRQLSSFYLVPFLKNARAMNRPPLLFTSLRDIQDCDRADQALYDRRVVKTVNSLMDGILVHSDPKFISLEDTFARTAELAVPVYYTGYAVSPTPLPAQQKRENVVLVSAGGGRGSLDLLLSMLEAQRHTSLARSYKMRIVTGALFEEESWSVLDGAAQDVPNLELIRWVPDLCCEMSKAAVSVSCCGYNTTLDILRTQTPALIFPAVELGNEQRYRAEKLERLGVWRLLPKNCSHPEMIETEIRKTIEREPASLRVDYAGAERTAFIVQDLIAGHVPDSLRS
jgi:predicted glycosyltransferase